MIAAHTPPAWLAGARWHYSHVIGGASDPVEVRTPEDDAAASDAKPGQLRLRVQRIARTLCVVDGAGCEMGHISKDGILPWRRYVMRRGSEIVWTLQTTSIVKKHHSVSISDGSVWRFDTPFFWWQQLVAVENDAPRLLGYVGPTKRVWEFAIEPGRDGIEIMAAVATMHRSWWRS